MKEHILLTGATGFLGSHLLAALLKQGFRVSILKRSTSDTWRISHLMSEVKAYDVDSVPLENAFKDQKIDAVIHAACSYGRNGQEAHEVVQTNLLFSLRLLDVAISYKTDAFFNTDTLLPKHINAYALSKKHFTEWLQQRSQSIQVINLKLEHMYGSKDDNAKFVPWVISQLQQNVARIPLTSGQQLRDFVCVDDVVSAYLLVLQKYSELPEFIEFDVGTGELTSVRDFVKTILISHKRYHPDTRTELGFGDLPMREGEMMNVDVDISGLRKLGWRAKTAYEQGILKIYKADK